MESQTRCGNTVGMDWKNECGVTVVGYKRGKGGQRNGIIVSIKEKKREKRTEDYKGSNLNIYVIQNLRRGFSRKTQKGIRYERDHIYDGSYTDNICNKLID